MKINGYPDKDHRFWYYSPNSGGHGMTFFQTAADRDAYAKDDIAEYNDHGWSLDVEHCCAGEITHTACQIDRREKPTDEEQAEDENWPEGFDFVCNYALRSIEEALK